MEVFKGVPISQGIAIGKAMIHQTHKIELQWAEHVSGDDEKKRFHEARIKSIDQVQAIYDQICLDRGEKEAEIFSAHISMLEDSELIEAVEATIDEQKCVAEWAVKVVSDGFVAMFQAMENAYMKERAMDIKDICARIQGHLSGDQGQNGLTLSEPVILVAHELTPSDTAGLNRAFVLGIINEVGGPTSHSAIIARMMGVPLVVCPNITQLVRNGQMVVFDGQAGDLFVEPTDDVLLEYEEKKSVYLKKKADLAELKGTKAITLDGYLVHLAANIGTPSDVVCVLENDAEGVGLFRTEFLYMGRNDFPDEEEQFAAYKVVCERLKGHPVVIRTLDIGGDKELDYLEIPKEMNPFLGCRAIRLCLKKIDLWKVQLRALLRASVYGELNIMFPMIATLGELRQGKEILEEVKAELREKGIPFREDVPVGMMMETPAAAVMSDLFAKEVDFFSIGTNDLIQYTMAVDRMNGDVAHLYSPYDPAVLRLVKKIVEAGHEAGIWVGICGEAAADPRLLPLWVGLGVDELSMSPGSILETRESVQNISKEASICLVGEIMKLGTAQEIEEQLSATVKTI